METPRVFSPEEVRTKLLTQIAVVADYWATLDEPDMTPLARCHGLAFSILVIFDGESIELPAFDLIPRPHPEDKTTGENWYKPTSISGTGEMHSEYAQLTGIGRI